MSEFFKKRFPLLLIVWPYLFFIIFIVNSSYYSVFLAVYTLLTVAVYISNIIYACRYKGEDAFCHMAFWNMLIKLLHIPFYIIVFLIGMLFFAVSVIPAFIFVTPAVIFILFMIDLLLMYITSIYGISALARGKRKGVISTTFLIVNIILHLFFVTDIISSVIVFAELKKHRGIQNG